MKMLGSAAETIQQDGHDEIGMMEWAIGIGTKLRMVHFTTQTHLCFTGCKYPPPPVEIDLSSEATAAKMDMATRYLW